MVNRNNGGKPTEKNPVIVDTKNHIVSIYYNPNSQELSRSGKSILLGSSRGFVTLEDIGISYNIIKKRE